ncbi:chromate efflux transporter [Rhizobium skierniewicense]|uniref:chromate efflux transporter n=1 Tax=Rhizobium skierniewicense TaxID=984260 RepID=UPI0015744CC9|nr:chromate efflux transporter [Rhizobium skierniewicense]NTF30976.1 chromate efflux transporter [Rhizobium skierniewicense]
MTDFVSPPPTAKPTLKELTSVFARIGFLSFGGPAGQIGMMHRVLVDERRWVSDARFMHALNYCMLLPGPEAQQLATYIGWLLHGVRGGIIAGTLFILPGFVTIVALAAAYCLYQDTHWLPGLLFGLKACVLAIVIEALNRVAKRALVSRFLVAIAAAAFIALFVFGLPFPLVILVAGLLGFLRGRRGDQAEQAHTDHENDAAPVTFLSRVMGLVLGLMIWQIPLAVIYLFSAPETLATLQSFFSRMAVVTFGGAYAVLAYVAQVAVETHGWLTAGEMLDGLALAEATPGPLVLVLPYIGFLAGFRHADWLDPMVAGVLGAMVTAWATFVPSFIFIFLGAPYVEEVRNNATLSAALSAITAAVVGVILNLSIWFGLHVLFAQVERIAIVPSFGPGISWPVWSTLDPFASGLLVASLLMLTRWKLGMVPVLALGIAGGVLRLWLI